MESDKSLAKQSVLQFWDELEQCLKRLAPSDYLPVAATILRDVLDNRDRLMSVYPPHFILHSMEAVCAYYRTYSPDEVSAKTFNRLMRVYQNFVPPAASHTLKQPGTDQDRMINLELFLIATARQQFTIQRTWISHDLARAIHLFLNKPFRDTEALFRAKFGFCFHDWVAFCICLFSSQTTPQTVGPCFLWNARREVVPRAMVETGFGLLSRTIEELGSEYRSLRERHSPLMEWQLRSLLVERPLIQIREGDYVVSHSQFILARACEGLYDLCRDNLAESFGKEFGTAFERYVRQLLEELPGELTILTENELAMFVPGAVCDYLVWTDDAVVLIECKAVEYAARFVTVDAIKGNNATTKIAAACTQLCNVSAALDQGRLSERLGPLGDRVLIGLVVTYRDVFLANGELYKSVIDPLVKLPDPYTIENLFRWRPQVMDIATFEHLVLSVQNGASLVTLFENKMAHSLAEVGEWDTYLAHHLEGKNGVFPFLEQVFDQFYEDIIYRLQH